MDVKIVTGGALVFAIFCIIIGRLLLMYWNVISFVMQKAVFFKPLDCLYVAHHGGELVAKVLKAHHVKQLFTLTGGHISPILVGAEKYEIQVISTRHEVTAVFAADAVARLTGNIGVAVVTAGPGFTNTITALKNAQMAQSPVLLIGGAAPTILKGRGALQDIEQLAVIKTICKYYTSVKVVRDIIPTIRKAIQIAKSDTPGPVFVEIPVNVLYPLDVVRKEVDKKLSSKSLRARIINWYLEWTLYNIFYCDITTDDVENLPIKVRHASDSQVATAMKLLSESKRPVLVIGSQAVIPAKQTVVLRLAVNNLQIPCFLGGMSRGLLGKNYPLQLKHTRRDVLKEADLVILAGAVCDFRLDYGKQLSKACKIIAVNRNKKDLAMNSDVFWKPTLSVAGCVSNFIRRLSELKSKTSLKIDNEWILSITKRDLAKEAQNRALAAEIPEHHLNPLKVLYNLDETLREDTIIIVDGGDFVSTASYIVKPRGPLKWLDPGPFGTLGVGAGFALGAKLCHPESDVVVIYGDGSLGYSIVEFDTFVRHKVHIFAIVGNDACWSQIAREQVPVFNSDVACRLTYVNYHQTVDSLGGKGVLFTATDQDELKKKLFAAFDVHYNGCSVLVNVLLSPSSFRAGSISV